MAKKKKQKSFSDYVVDARMDDAQRVAHFLYWCGQEFPGRYAPMTHIVRVAYALPRLPKETDERIDLFKNKRMRRVRDILRNEYRCVAFPKPGFGYRVSTSAADLVVNAEEKAVKRVASAHSNLSGLRELIDRKELAKKPALRARHDKIGRILKQLQKQSVGLLPPLTKKEKKHDVN
jgi:hypothetical protein